MENSTHDTADMPGLINRLCERLLAGGRISDDEAYTLAALSEPAHIEALHEAAARVTAALCPRQFDTCSIVNARSGRCPENCRWCAQSAHYNTGCDVYPLIDADSCMRAASHCGRLGIGRFSMVASGRAMRGAELAAAAAMLHDIGAHCGVRTCASLGLLGHDELMQLWQAGVRRYHCNLETAPSYFPALCSTHTIDDKLAAIRAARAIGFEVCSGGIIGMGESMVQRAELALTLRTVEPASIPINILCPIPGTPLADAEPLSERDVLTTVAIFRMVHPRVQLRFAGGRASLSHRAQLQAMRIGINGAIVGDLLTTVGSTVDNDRQLVAEAGYTF